jgi:hypothetical protein
MAILPLTPLVLLARFPIPFVAFWVFLKHGYVWWHAMLFGILTWMFYIGIFLPIFMNANAMIALWACPPPWKPMHPPADLPYPIATRFRLFMSEPILVFFLLLLVGVAVFGCISKLVPGGWDGWTRKAGVFVWVVLVRIVMVKIQSSARFHAWFVLLRSFRPKSAFGIKSSVIPSLRAYGEVETVFDDTISEAAPVNPEDVPLGDAREVRTDSDKWRDQVKQMIETADVVVFDVTEISHWLSWELAQAFRLRDHSIIILVCQPASVLIEETPLFERLQQSLSEHIDAATASELIQRLQLPIFYTTDLLNLTFCWHLYKRLKSIARRK